MKRQRSHIEMIAVTAFTVVSLFNVTRSTNALADCSANVGCSACPAETTGIVRSRPPGVPDADDGRLQNELAAANREKPLYTPDNRQDEWEVRDKVIRAQLRSSVALFRSSQLSAGKDSLIKLNGSTMSSSRLLCDDERFSAQLSAAFCSGILVRPDMVLTAAHCISEVAKTPESVKVADIRFVFHYFASGKCDAGKSVFDSTEVFNAKKIVNGVYITDKKSKRRGEDWALVQLDRDVTPDIATPVAQYSTGSPKIDEPIYVVGYPTGLPAKYSPGAVVTRSNPSEPFFLTNLNTFGGNSGSGVFLEKDNRLLGVLVRGERRDYYWDGNAKCVRAYVCPKNGCAGETVVRFSTVKMPD